MITRHSRPVAFVRPFQPAMLAPDRRAAVERAVRLMQNAPKLGTTRRFTREEIHAR